MSFSAPIPAQKSRAGPPQLPPDSEIIARCDEHKRIAQSSYNCLVFPSPDYPTAFIKYGPENLGIRGEMRNHVFAWEMLYKLPLHVRSGIEIPEVYRVIESDGMIYIIMEYIRGKTLGQLIESDSVDQEKLDRIARAIKLFLSFEAESQTLGPVGGGIIWHPLFKDTVASVEYKSVEELQNHLTRVANCPVDNKLKIDFTGERICFCFADLFEGNFIFTDTGSLHIVDYLHTSFLPASFMTYALDQPRPVCIAIKDEFDLPQTNLAAMRVAGHYFMISSRHIGFDVDREKLRARRKKMALNYATGPMPPRNIVES